jgi:hypothetical protein
MTMELIDFVQNQASVLSVTDLNRLIADLPVVSPLRLDSFYSSMKTLQRSSEPD